MHVAQTSKECATVIQQPCGGRKFKPVFVCPKKFVWAPRSPTTSALENDGEERRGERTTHQWDSRDPAIGRLGARNRTNQVTGVCMPYLRVEDKRYLVNSSPYEWKTKSTSLIRHLPPTTGGGTDRTRTCARGGRASARGSMCLLSPIPWKKRKKKRWVRACEYVCIHTHTHRYIYIYMDIYVYMYVCVYMDAHSHMKGIQISARACASCWKAWAVPLLSGQGIRKEVLVDAGAPKGLPKATQTQGS